MLILFVLSFPILLLTGMVLFGMDKQKADILMLTGDIPLNTQVIRQNVGLLFMGMVVLLIAGLGW